MIKKTETYPLGIHVFEEILRELNIYKGSMITIRELKKENAVQDKVESLRAPYLYGRVWSDPSNFCSRAYSFI